MNQEYQKIIDKCKNNLKNIDLNQLRPLLQEREIFYETEDADAFYNSLCLKDAYAFPKFIHILSKSGYINEAKMLKDKCSEDYTPHIYNMSSKPVGLCLIINNIKFDKSKPREGSELDVVALDSLFESLGFEVTIKQNLKGHEMENCLKEFSENSLLDKVDSIVVYILTHGNRSKEQKHNVDILRGTDEKEVILKNVYEMFNHHNCKKLLGKPKIFFFQACRGKEEDLGHFRESQLENTDLALYDNNDPSSLTVGHVPSITDTIIVHSTMPCCVSVTNKHLGSWLCQEVVRVFTVDHSRHDLCTMLKTVCKRMEDRTSSDKLKQTVHIELFGVTGIVKFGQKYKRKTPNQGSSANPAKRQRS